VALKDFITRANTIANQKPAGVKGFSCDLEDIFERGEEGLRAAYTAFVNGVDGVLVSRVANDKSLYNNHDNNRYQQ